MIVKKIGDWAKAMRVTNPGNMARALKKVGDGVLSDMADVMARNLEDAILSGAAEGPALAAGTVARKGSGTKLVETGLLASLVEVRRHGSCDYTAGLHPDRGHRKLNVATLMAYQEKGTSTIPPRPVVAPTVRETEPELQRIGTDSKIGVLIWWELGG